MNNSDSYSNKDDVASATWSNPLWALGDYPYLSVPQNTHPGLVSAPGYPSTAASYVPNINATDDAAFSLGPTTKTGAFENLRTQVDFTNQVSSQCVVTSTWTHSVLPQNVVDPWFMLALCMFLS